MEEVALRNKGLQLRLRAYLILVDGTKSSAEIKSLNHGLPEVEMVLAALCDEGYLEAVGGQTTTSSSSDNQARPSSPASTIWFNYDHAIYCYGIITGHAGRRVLF